MDTYTGDGHCGAVRSEVDAGLPVALRCKGSICRSLEESKDGIR